MIVFRDQVVLLLVAVAFILCFCVFRPSALAPLLGSMQAREQFLNMGPLFFGCLLGVIAFLIARIRRLLSPLRDMNITAAIMIFPTAMIISSGLQLIRPTQIFTETSLTYLFVQAWLPLSAFVLGFYAIWKSRRVRVLVLRSFHSDPGEMHWKTLRRVLQPLGRVEALRAPGSSTHAEKLWTLIGHADHWTRGVQRILEKVDLVVADISHETPNLRWELEQLAKVKDTPHIYIQREGASGGTFPLDSPPILYRAGEDPVFVDQLKWELARLKPEIALHRKAHRYPSRPFKEHPLLTAIAAYFGLLVLIVLTNWTT